MKRVISVIIPVYNCEKYIAECLDSVIQQTYTDIQIIAIDDGSTDKSGEILDRYAQKDARIQVLHSPNGGASAARNAGLAHAVGEFVTFVDSDDIIEPDMYQYMLAYFSEEDVDIVHCGYTKINRDGTLKRVRGACEQYRFGSAEGMLHFIKGDLFTGALWNKIYRRKILDRISFDNNIKINEDVLFNFYAFREARRSVFLSKTFYHYYERENASTQRTGSLKKASDCKAVAATIFEESQGEPYETAARSKYIMALMSLYRALLYEDISGTANERRELQKLLDQLLTEENDVRNKYVNNYNVMRRIPYIYLILYSIYNKLRKPNWDV